MSEYEMGFFPCTYLYIYTVYLRFYCVLKSNDNIYIIFSLPFVASELNYNLAGIWNLLNSLVVQTF